MRTVAITQARLGSSRLPGKVLKTVAGRTLLQHHLERVARIPGVDAVVVAIPDRAHDDAVAEHARAAGYAVHRGPEDDVLERFRGAAVAAGAECVVRVTSDCPLIDPAVSGEVVARLHRGDCEYASNTLIRSYPRGLDTEACTMAALLAAAAEARDPAEREHVTPFLYRRPERFRIAQIATAEACGDWRWTVDTPEDFRFASLVLEELARRSAPFAWAATRAVLADHPEWMEINRHIVQKPVS
jgi:spore coat polysaccharide biosynthesis protein SpsF